MKYIWCVMTDEDGGYCLSCFNSEDKAIDALSFWDSGAQCWIEKYPMYSGVKQMEKELERACVK